MKSRKRLERQAFSSGKATGGGDVRWLYGIHPVLAALANPARHCQRLLMTPETAKSLPGPLPAHPPPEIADRRQLDQLLPPGAVHQGIAVAVEPLPELDLERACAPIAQARNLVVVLDQVTDPHNIGAILRSAAAFDARALIVTERHAPEATGVLAKAASGALELVPLLRVTNLARALEQLAELGYWRVGLDGKARETLAEVNPGESVVLVLGAEGAGLRRLTREHCDLMARLPIGGRMESLNVSNAAAVAMYEMARRPRPSPAGG